MNYTLLLLPILALIASGIVLVAATTEPDNMSNVNNATVSSAVTGLRPTVLLNITTHNPACTAAFLNHTGVTRLTDVWPYYHDDDPRYPPGNYERGINITAIIWLHQTNETVAAVIERTEVSRVAAYLHTAQNATSPVLNATSPVLNATSPVLNATSHEQPQLLALAIGPRAETFLPLPSECGPLPHRIADAILEDIGWAGAGPNASPADISRHDTEQGNGPVTLTIDKIPYADIESRTGAQFYGDLIAVSVGTYNVNATWAYLKEIGALVASVHGEERPLGYRGYLVALIQPSLVFGIIERDEVPEIQVDILLGRMLTP